MNKRFAQLIVTAALIGPVVSIGHEVVAQNLEAPKTLEKDSRRQMKNEEKNKKELEKNDRWVAKQEAKMIERRQKDLNLTTPLSARGSEVKVYHDGEYVTLGYFDSSNVFRPAVQKSEPITKTGVISPHK